MALLTEELPKYFSLVLARRYGRVIHERDYILIPIAAALGFSLFENIDFVYGEAVADHFQGALIGVHLLRRVRGDAGMSSIVRVLAVRVFFHGLFDFVLFAICAWEGNVGWVHPRGATMWVGLVLASSIVAVLVVVLRRSLHDVRVGKIAKVE